MTGYLTVIDKTGNVEDIIINNHKMEMTKYHGEFTELIPNLVFKSIENGRVVSEHINLKKTYVSYYEILNGHIKDLNGNDYFKQL